MVEFRMYGENPDYTARSVDEDRIEEPIIPINELGVTVPEHDPATGGHVLKNIEAAIRKGASTMQLMWQTQSGSAIGGRPKAYGRDVREAIRELLDANQVTLAASELPTSSNTNMSGMGQEGHIDETKRQRDLREVKDVIDFQVEVGGGGGVDIFSQEFMRTISDDKKRINSNKDYQFFDYSPEELRFQEEVEKGVNNPLEKPNIDSFGNRIQNAKYLYDKQTGRLVSGISMSTKVHRPKYLTAKDFEEDTQFGGTTRVGEFDENRKKRLGDGIIKADDMVDATGNWIDQEKDMMKRIPKWDSEKNRFETEEIGWVDYVREAKKYNENNPKDQITPEEYAYRESLNNQIMQHRGQSSRFTGEYENIRRAIKHTHEKEQEFKKRKEKLEQIFKGDEKGLRFAIEQEAKTLAQEIPQTRGGGAFNPSDPESSFKDMKKYFEHELNYIQELSASSESQVQELTKKQDNVLTPEEFAGENTKKSYAELGMYAMSKSKDPRAKRDVYVGPELGWPTAFGGHPEEFIEVIKGAREKMAQQLVENDRHISKDKAQELAKKHIRGDFDTSHLAMWYNHFAEEPGESEEKKLKRFNKWYMEMVDKMYEEDVIGSIQVVDSITGQHSHLPPGQGIFPVVDAVKRLKEKGWKGDIVSEGHEEEKFGQGRIMTETWKAFGSPIGSGYWGGSGGGSPRSWRGVESGYFGATQPPTYIVGAYVPSNEWSLWSETPFE